nr:hypothetical protein [uncultured Solibaculum sp.]
MESDTTTFGSTVGCAAAGTPPHNNAAERMAVKTAVDFFLIFSPFFSLFESKRFHSVGTLFAIRMISSFDNSPCRV